MLFYFCTDVCDLIKWKNKDEITLIFKFADLGHRSDSQKVKHASSSSLQYVLSSC